MAWWYNTESGALTSAGSVQSFFQQVQGDVGLGSGWHHLQIADNATAQQAAAEARKEFPRGAPPTTDVGQQAVQEAQQVTTGSGLSGLSAIGDFFSRLTQPSTWIRVAEVIAGIGLIIVSLAKLAADTPVGRAATRAGKTVRIL